MKLAAASLLLSSVVPGALSAEKVSFRGAGDRSLAGIFDPDEGPFERLCGVYYGSSSATILGRTLFGGCKKASSKEECGNEGFYVFNFMSQAIDCEQRCLPNTCQGATITIAAAKDDMQMVPGTGKISGTVSITITGGLSKDGTDCAGGAANGFTIDYECHATSNQGASKFTCSNLVLVGPGGSFEVPAGVLAVRANLSSAGNLIWTASGEVPPEDVNAPASGELPQMPGTLLPTGNIDGTKMQEFPGDCMEAAPASALVALSDEMKAEWCAASAPAPGNGKN